MRALILFLLIGCAPDDDTADTDTDPPPDCDVPDWLGDMQKVEPDPIVDICTRYMEHAMAMRGVEAADLPPQDRVQLITPDGALRLASAEQWADSDLFKRLVVTQAAEKQALCNDGSPGAYYFRPSPTESSKWLIFLQGGGACTSPKGCDKRWGVEPDEPDPDVDFDAHLMSNCEEPVVATFGGMLSTKMADNPDFYDWNLVLVEYCSSDTFNGDAAPSDERAWHFRGKRIVHGVLQDLQDDSLTPYHRLAEATEVLFGGGSAGSGGLRMNLDAVAEWLPHTQVCGLADAAYRPDEALPAEPTEAMKAVLAYLNPVVESSCYAQTCDPYLCTTTTPVGLYHVTTPYFVQMDQHDKMALGSSATPEEKDKFAGQIRDMLTERPGAFSPRNGGHVYGVFGGFNNITIPVDGLDYSYADVLGAWYFDRSELEDSRPAWKAVVLGPDGEGTGRFSEIQGGMCGGGFPK